jgi:hypothetical protein
MDEHLAGTNLTALTRGSVLFVILREGLFELQGDAFAHHSDAIHRIDESFTVAQLGNRVPRASVGAYSIVIDCFSARFEPQL